MQPLIGASHFKRYIFWQHIVSQIIQVHNQFWVDFTQSRANAWPALSTSHSSPIERTLTKSPFLKIAAAEPLLRRTDLRGGIALLLSLGAGLDMGQRKQIRSEVKVWALGVLNKAKSQPLQSRKWRDLPYVFPRELSTKQKSILRYPRYPVLT